MIQPEWRELLEASLQEPGGNHWLAHLHLGLMYYSVGNSAAAEDAWQRSLRRRPSGWALRNLAVLRKIKGRYDEAVSYYHKAHQLLPTLRPLLVEYCESLLAANRPEEVLALIESLAETNWQPQSGAIAGSQSWIGAGSSRPLSANLARRLRTGRHPRRRDEPDRHVVRTPIETERCGQ